MGVEIGIGISTEAEVLLAGTQAAEQALAHLAGRMPDLVIVFSSVRFADPRLLKGVRSVTGKVPLIGCSDAGGISTSGPKRRSVTVVGLAADSGRFITGLARGISKNAFLAGETLARTLLKAGDASPRGLMMLPDGLTANGSELLRGIQKEAPVALPIFGGAAADDFFFQRSFQYYNDEVLSDAMPAVLFCGDIRVGVGVHHGWVPLGKPRTITQASGRTIHQLDSHPAVGIYEDYLGLSRQELAQTPLAQVAITYPLGISVPGQAEYLLRDAIGIGDEGSLICTGELPVGSSVRLMIGGYEAALEAAQQAAYAALEQVGREHIRGALIFSSVARQKVLGSEFHGEVDVIRDALGGSGIRLGGFYSYGEIAPVAGPHRQVRPALFHNESVVVVGLG